MVYTEFLNDSSETSFEGHLDDLYDPDIHHSLELHDQHLEDALHSTSYDDFAFHVEHANDALHTAEYFQDCKDQAILDEQYHQASLDSIIKPAEIADKYQRELQEIFNPHVSHVSFGSNLGNMYDRNARNFLEECHRLNVDLPISVDHSYLNSEAIVDRFVNGGLTSIDKTLIRNTLDTYHGKGNLSDDEYNDLISRLSKC